MFFRPYRFIYFAVLAIAAYVYFGWGGVALVTLASIDITVGNN